MDQIKTMIENNPQRTLPHILQIGRDMQHSVVTKAIQHNRSTLELKKASTKRDQKDPLYTKSLLSKDNIRPSYGKIRTTETINTGQLDAKGQPVTTTKDVEKDDPTTITKWPSSYAEHI
jgi:hypothetical protein